MQQPRFISKSGHYIVACFLAEYSDEEPQLGKIVNVPNHRSFQVEWMVGAYSEPWRIWREKKDRTMSHGKKQYRKNQFYSQLCYQKQAEYLQT